MIIGGRLSGRKVFRSQLLWCCDCFVSAVVLLLFLGGGVKVPCRGRRALSSLQGATFATALEPMSRAFSTFEEVGASEGG